MILGRLNGPQAVKVFRSCSIRVFNVRISTSFSLGGDELCSEYVFSVFRMLPE